MKKNIWIAWLQGLSDPSIPKFNLDCINRIKDLNQDWNINIITYDNVIDFLPNFLHIVESYPNRLKAHQSDLLRLMLLEKYGGIWIDSSVYLMSPLDDFIDNILNKTNFFAYRFDPRSIDLSQGNRDIAVWFLAVNNQNHYLIKTWLKFFYKTFCSSSNIPYFSLSNTLCELYDDDLKIRLIIDNMTQISERIPHSALCHWSNRLSSYMYKRPNLNHD